MTQLSHLILSLVFFFLTCQGWTHPVAFKDSTGIMGYHTNVMSHNQINYSFRHWFAIGLHYIRRPLQSSLSDAGLVSGNFLLHRWNSPRLQANLYGVAGAGSSQLAGQSELTGMAGIQFDIEDRDYYFLAKHQRLFSQNRNELNSSVLRFGVSPYVAQFDELHSWIILEWQENVFDDQSRVDDLTPYLRFFYKNLLFEIGQSFNGLTRFNYISHF